VGLAQEKSSRRFATCIFPDYPCVLCSGASGQLTYVHPGCQMSCRDVSKKKVELRTSGSTYGRVDFVHPEARVQIREWRNRRSYPGRRKCCLSTNVRRVVGVENLRLPSISKHRNGDETMANRKLILMGMAPEYI
jgi:hypothetical protein